MAPMQTNGKQRTGEIKANGQRGMRRIAGPSHLEVLVKLEQLQAAVTEVGALDLVVVDLLHNLRAVLGRCGQGAGNPGTINTGISLLLGVFCFLEQA
jgi:hypothetical protein